MALAVPLSRFTSQVGGGSAFFVRHQRVAMTKQEFISKVQAFKNISAKGAIVAVLSVFAVAAICMAGIAAMVYAKTEIKNQWVSVPITLAAFCVWISILGICYQLFIRSLKFKLLRLDLVCPGCGSLFLGRAASAVVATGNCVRCGKKILDDKADA